MVLVKVMELLSKTPRMTMKLEYIVGAVGMRVGANVFTINVSLLLVFNLQKLLTSSFK